MLISTIVILYWLITNVILFLKDIINAFELEMKNCPVKSENCHLQCFSLKGSICKQYFVFSIKKPYQIFNIIEVHRYLIFNYIYLKVITNFETRQTIKNKNKF